MGVVVPLFVGYRWVHVKVLGSDRVHLCLESKGSRKNKVINMCVRGVCEGVCEDVYEGCARDVREGVWVRGVCLCVRGVCIRGRKASSQGMGFFQSM